jgi:hypothetical protein
LVVNKCYDDDFSRQYQAILAGNSNMRQENIEALNMTKSVLQHRGPARSQYQSLLGIKEANLKGVKRTLKSLVKGVENHAPRRMPKRTNALSSPFNDPMCIRMAGNWGI